MNYKTERDLTNLYNGENDPQIEVDLAHEEMLVDMFVTKWKSNINYLTDADFLYEALEEYNNLIESVHYGKPRAYFAYLQSLYLDEPKWEAKCNQMSDHTTKLFDQIAFFELGIATIAHENQIMFLSSEKLSEYRNFLQRIFEGSKFLLSEKEEIIINNLQKTAYDNRTTLSEKIIAGLVSEVTDDAGVTYKKTFENLLTMVCSTNKEERTRGVAEVNKVFAAYADVAEAEMNAIMQYKKTVDELRGMPRPDLSRIMDDDLDETIVDVLNETVIDRFDISQRFYALKAKLMEQDCLLYNERNVPLGTKDEDIKIADALVVVGKVFKQLDENFYDIYVSMLEKGKVDCFSRKGKKGGARCYWNTPGDPHIIINFEGKRRDCDTIAHEFGHAIHSKLITCVKALNRNVGMFVAETPSTFFEDFVFEEMMHDLDKQSKLFLLMGNLNDKANTIQRQIACYNFEKELHREFREKGYVGKEEIGSIFKKRMSAYCGDAVDCGNGFENRWIHWVHIRDCFYVYSYAGGLLISKALQALVKSDDKNIEKVKTFFRTGTSEKPVDTFAKLGIDITSKEFWNKGLDEMEQQLFECEKLAKELGYN